MSQCAPVPINEAFEAEARAMAKAMETGDLPPESAPCYRRVRALALMHWDAIELRERERKARASLLDQERRWRR
jgi:hypothetical protein